MAANVWEILGLAAKFALYVGVLTSCGAVLFRMVFRGPQWSVALSVRPAILVFAGLGVVASIFSYALRGAVLTGEASGMFDTEILRLLWDTPVGTAFVFRLSGFGLMLASLLFPRGGRFFATAGVALVLWSFGQIGHATRFEFPWLSVILSVHLAAAAFWAGVLAPLYQLAGNRERLADAADLAYRFAQIASVLVPVLFFAGLVFGWYLLGSVKLLLTTGYGLVLLVKIALFCILLGFSAMSKLRFVPIMQRGEFEGAKRLRKVIAGEWFVLVVILLTTSILTGSVSLPH